MNHSHTHPKASTIISNYLQLGKNYTHANLPITTISFGQRLLKRRERTHISNPPLATKAILIAALPALLSEWAIFPPSSFDAAKVWKVLHLLGKVGDDRDEPYSTAILVLALEHRERDWSSLGLSEREERGDREVGTVEEEIDIQSLSEVGQWFGFTSNG